VTPSARSIASATISFGLVSIPVKVYTAAMTHDVGFNLLHKKCGGRLRQQYRCHACTDAVLTGSDISPEPALVGRDDMVKGFEFAKDQYVQFTEDELKKLQAGKTDSLEITEFVPADSVDPVEIEKSYYLGPDKGGDKSYQLLAQVMEKRKKIAIGRYWTRGRLQLVLLRSHHHHGLVMQYVYYANETRSFDEIGIGGPATFQSIEVDLADKLISKMSSPEFKVEMYRDEYQDRIRAAVDQKVAGREITIAEESPQPVILDLFEALKRSLM
jgi:DNA end-binding protein Ku